jgi:nucleoside phosphorylase
VKSNKSVLTGNLGVLSVPHGRPLSLDQVAVGIVTALPEEFAAVCEVLGCQRPITAMREGGDNRYRLGVVREQAGQWGIVVAVGLLNNMGNVTAATRATNMVADCPQLRDIIVCGIAGAVPNPAKPDDHVRLGDIVVSGNGVLQYDFGKQVENGFKITAGVQPPSHRLLASARSLQSDELVGKRPWELYIDSGLRTLGSHFERPAPSTDVLREANSSAPNGLCNKVIGCVRRWWGGDLSHPTIPHPDDPLRIRNPERPRVFHGLIASASRVLKDPRMRNRLRTEYNAKAIEMETAGAAHAAYIGNIGYFVVRGTCDYCNQDKNDVWHPYAALIAAAYTRALLEATDVLVFKATPKVLTIVEPVSRVVEPRADTHAVVPPEYVERALNETKKAEATSSDLQPGDSDMTLSRTSDAVREIPRIGNQSDETSSQATISSLRIMLPRDLYLTETTQYSATIDVAVVANTIGSERLIHETTVLPPSDREQQLLAAEGERHLSELKDFLERWEFDRAFRAETVVVDWIAKNEKYIDPALASQIYMVLARVETTKVNLKQEAGGENSDITKARYYLSKAKDVSSR